MYNAGTGNGGDILYFQSDYILRMIQMMGDFFRRLLETVSETEKADEYDRLMRRQCGLDANTAASLTAESLIELLPDTPRFVLSEMLYVRAYAFPLHDEEAEACLYKAYKLLLSVGNENLICELRKDRLLELFNRAYGLLTPQDMVEAVRFLLLADDFAKAEDILFDAIETSVDSVRGDVIASGKKLFEPLLSRSDKELKAGGLSLTEAREIVTELSAMLCQAK